MLYRYSFGLLRLAIGISLLGSVVWQVTDRLIANRFRPTEYFVFFSIDSSIFAGVVALIGAYVLFKGKEESDRLMTVRLVAAVSMIIVGVVYHALLGDGAVDARDIGYEWPRIPNLVIHTWAPIAVFLDYLLSYKGGLPRWRKALWVIVYPLVWLSFSIVRGLLDGWWPYWFINPNSEIGITGMLTYILIIAISFISLGYLVSGARMFVARMARRLKLRN
ncbi:unannotated protein [freshwater metagenome]|uniref:Unannotated protein n=1 Tax=freshwater metagenome TaxID=449393 RepID=A0A6J6EL48_9ZZZZ|nr:hypothetical protein [Actinomycetota bacterium]